MLRALAVCACVVASSVVSGRPAPRIQPPALTAAQWTEDARQLITELEKRHASLYHSVSRDAFQAAAKRVIDSIPAMKPHETIVALAKLVALVHDGHTELGSLQPAAGFHRTAVSIFRYGDSMFVVAADSANRTLLGARVDSIGNVTANEAYQRATSLVSRDNDEEFHYSVPAHLMSPEVLAALRVGTSLDRVEIAVTLQNGTRQHASLTAYPNTERKPYIRLIDLAPNGAPLYSTNLTTDHWFTYLAESKTLYLALRTSSNQRNHPSIASVIADVLAAIDKQKPDRIVVDVRANNGGNVNNTESLVDGIRKRTQYHTRGKLFVITGRTTFSAGTDLASQLKRAGSALIVGEPSRGAPFEPGNREAFTLRNSKLSVDYSEKLSPQFAAGASRVLPVDIAAPPSITATRTGTDPAMDAILRFQ